jgi:hypothetical protein
MAIPVLIRKEGCRKVYPAIGANMVWSALIGAGCAGSE